MTTTSSSATEIATKARPWWLLLLQGSFALLIGAILLWAPAKTKVETYQILVALLGIYWLIGGIMDLVHMFTDHTGWGWKLIMGVISIIAGAYILMYPIAAGVTLPKIFVLVLGIWGLMQGIFALILAFKGGGWGLGILGVVGIIFGLILIGNYTLPGMGLTMIWVAALWGVIGGIIMIVQAFRQRS
ncbi:MAG: DUF308 domain-containing protein [Anaerolineae bacterium]|nr:DUF308 domain-containing protein [Anaerolineae bacterium]